MFGLDTSCQIDIDRPYHPLEDYQGSTPRWCPGCGDNAILTAVQKLCRDEQLPPEKTVFVSGIGCSSRFPHYMKTYGFHALHGRALPIAQGIRLRRPDLHVFVNMGDGDCCSIGTAHWIHAIRYNFQMVAMMHDNQVYGLTKKQASPTSPKGMKTNTTPFGTYLAPLNPLATTLGVSNVSFVAQAAEWIPEMLYDILKEAYNHRGFSFIRILQRCPHYTPALFDPAILDPKRVLVLEHDDGIQASESLQKSYTTRQTHDPADLHAARQIAEHEELLPVGILYRNENIERYDETRKRTRVYTPEMRRQALEAEFAKFLITPAEA